MTELSSEPLGIYILHLKDKKDNKHIYILSKNETTSIIRIRQNKNQTFEECKTVLIWLFKISVQLMIFLRRKKMLVLNRHLGLSSKDYIIDRASRLVRLKNWINVEYIKLIGRYPLPLSLSIIYTQTIKHASFAHKDHIHYIFYR